MMKLARLRGIEITYEETGEGVPVVLLRDFPFNREEISSTRNF